MRALVVDDSRAARTIPGRVSRDLGLNVIHAGHGGEALARLDEHGPRDLARVIDCPEDAGDHETASNLHTPPLALLGLAAS